MLEFDWLALGVAVKYQLPLDNSPQSTLMWKRHQAFSTHRRPLMSERLIKTPIRYYFATLGRGQKEENMSVYATIDLDSLMCKLSNKELYDFMLETFRDRVPDESHPSLIAEMFKVMYDTDQEEAIVTILKDMGDDAKSVIEEYLKSIPSECLQDYENMIRYL